MSQIKNILTFSDGETEMDVGEIIANAQDVLVFASDERCEEQLNGNDYHLIGNTLTIITDQEGKRITVVGLSCPEITKPKVGPISAAAICAHADQVATRLAWLEHLMCHTYRTPVGFDQDKSERKDIGSILDDILERLEGLELSAAEVAEATEANQAAQIETTDTGKRPNFTATFPALPDCHDDFPCPVSLELSECEFDPPNFPTWDKSLPVPVVSENFDLRTWEPPKVVRIEHPAHSFLEPRIFHTTGWEPFELPEVN